MVGFPLPYADIVDLPPEELHRRIERDHTEEFSHSLETQIRGQFQAGFVLTHFVEDKALGTLDTGRFRFSPICLATRVSKP